MNDLITEVWLQQVHHYQPIKAAHGGAGFARDFGEGFVLQLIPHDTPQGFGWILEVWNEAKVGHTTLSRQGAGFRHLLTRQSELLMVQSLMEDVPF